MSTTLADLFPHEFHRGGAKKQPMNLDITTDVQACQRCGGNHANLSFRRMSNAADEWTHWALCPTLKEPILLKIETQTLPDGVAEGISGWYESPPRSLDPNAEFAYVEFVTFHGITRKGKYDYKTGLFLTNPVNAEDGGMMVHPSNVEKWRYS